jgi:drug/metabolite transporter (DMT)-like permease
MKGTVDVADVAMGIKGGDSLDCDGGGESTPVQPQSAHQGRAPRWVYAVLAAAVTGVSSAGALFQHIDEVPPLLRASWRLQLTALLLVPMAVVQWRQCDATVRSRCFELRTLLLLLASGVSLAGHFGFWVVSLDKTSLTHSLLFVTAHPLVLVAGAAAAHSLVPRCLSEPHASRLVAAVRFPSLLECAGAGLGVAGAGITLLDVGGDDDDDDDNANDNPVTAEGDLFALLGAIAIIGYIVIGRILRVWMPLGVYAFPVTFIAAALLLVCAVIGEADGVAEFGSTPATSPSDIILYFWLLASISGIIGHTGLNLCLRYIAPLLVSVAVTMEPVIGSVIGVAFFGSATPGLFTALGTPVMIAGVVAVIYGGKRAADALDAGNDDNDVVDAQQRELESGVVMTEKKVDDTTKMMNDETTDTTAVSGEVVELGVDVSATTALLEVGAA